MGMFIRILSGENETDCIICNVIQMYNTIYYIQIKFTNILKLHTIVGYMHTCVKTSNTKTYRKYIMEAFNLPEEFGHCFLPGPLYSLDF